MHKETKGKSKLRNEDYKNSTDKKKNTHIQKKKGLNAISNHKTVSEMEKKITGYADQQNGYRLGKLQEMVKDREACHAAVREVAKSRTRLSD